jgi:hypothetical protein
MFDLTLNEILVLEETGYEHLKIIIRRVDSGWMYEYFWEIDGSIDQVVFVPYCQHPHADLNKVEMIDPNKGNGPDLKGMMIGSRPVPGGRLMEYYEEAMMEFRCVIFVPNPKKGDKIPLISEDDVRAKPQRRRPRKKMRRPQRRVNEEDKTTKDKDGEKI